MTWLDLFFQDFCYFNELVTFRTSTLGSFGCSGMLPGALKERAWRSALEKGIIDLKQKHHNMNIYKPESCQPELYQQRTRTPILDVCVMYICHVMSCVSIPARSHQQPLFFSTLGRSAIHLVCGTPVQSTAKLSSTSTAILPPLCELLLSPAWCEDYHTLYYQEERAWTDWMVSELISHCPTSSTLDPLRMHRWYILEYTLFASCFSSFFFPSFFTWLLAFAFAFAFAVGLVFGEDFMGVALAFGDLFMGVALLFGDLFMGVALALALPRPRDGTMGLAWPRSLSYFYCSVTW